jgi:hypothetical protein
MQVPSDIWTELQKISEKSASYTLEISNEYLLLTSWQPTLRCSPILVRCYPNDLRLKRWLDRHTDVSNKCRQLTL